MSATVAPPAAAGSRNFGILRDKVTHGEAANRAAADLEAEDVEQRLAALAEQEEIERMLADLKASRRSG